VAILEFGVQDVGGTPKKLGTVQGFTIELSATEEFKRCKATITLGCVVI